jgi:hypothetical protein
MEKLDESTNFELATDNLPKTASVAAYEEKHGNIPQAQYGHFEMSPKVNTQKRPG